MVDIKKFSLLPYLEAVNSDFYLKISLSTEDPSLLEKTAFPFLVITDSDPLSRMIEARFLTGAGSELMRVCLTVQKDRYGLAKDGLWPVNNKDIDEFWQRTFSICAQGKQDPSFILLSYQIGEKGRLTALEPLFFCKTRQLFFAPPCPRCGFPLEQCLDDDLLIQSGLQPYSASLKRYLFCPSCLPKGNADFYVYEMESSDPPSVKDRYALVREFRLLCEGKNQTTRIPCVNCTKNQECYGSGHEAPARIVPFSFYPFYLFIHEAMSLNAPDFLALISGAAIEEVVDQLRTRGEPGRIGCLHALQHEGLKRPFFFRSDERFFGEILYLKLSFLGELIRTIFSAGEVYNHPDLRLSIDRVWVNLRDPGGLLPFFWHFKVKSIDLGRSPLGPAPCQLPASYGLYLLGLTWFYTLLVNKKQDMSKIALSFKDDFSFERMVKHPAFLPENIFWNPEGKAVSNRDHLFWERALRLGWALLSNSFQSDPQWSREDFCRQLEELREEVKGHLFEREPKDRQEIASVPVKTAVAEDEAIHDILTKITDKWRTLIEEEKGELRETVILSSLPPPRGRGVAKEVAEEELKETVILSPGNLQKEVLRPSLKEPIKEERDVREVVPETVILSPSKSGKDFGFPPKAEKAGDDRKTMVESSEEDFLAETVLLGPRKAPEKKKEKKND